MTLDLVAAQGELSSIRAEKQAAEEAIASLREETFSLKRGLADPTFSSDICASISP